jgi:hypothetical protein
LGLALFLSSLLFRRPTASAYTAANTTDTTADKARAHSSIRILLHGFVVIKRQPRLSPLQNLLADLRGYLSYNTSTSAFSQPSEQSAPGLNQKPTGTYQQSIGNTFERRLRNSR